MINLLADGTEVGGAPWWTSEVPEERFTSREGWWGRGLDVVGGAPWWTPEVPEERFTSGEGWWGCGLDLVDGAPWWTPEVPGGEFTSGEGWWGRGLDLAGAGIPDRLMGSAEWGACLGESW